MRHFPKFVSSCSRSRYQKLRAWGELVDGLWERGDVTASMNLEDLFDQLNKKIDIAMFCSSPLVILARLGCLDFLNRVFPRVYISNEIHYEVVIAGAGLRGASEVSKAEWIEVKSIQNPAGLHSAQRKYGLAISRGSKRRHKKKRASRVAPCSAKTRVRLGTNASRKAPRAFD